MIDEIRHVLSGRNINWRKKEEVKERSRKREKKDKKHKVNWIRRRNHEIIEVENILFLACTNIWVPGNEFSMPVSALLIPPPVPVMPVVRV